MQPISPATGMIAQETLEEDDAELILAVMREHATKVENKLDYIIQNFPNLMKSVFNFCAHVSDKELLAEALLKLLKSPELQEFQLFWFGHILEAHLMGTKKASRLVDAIYNHVKATTFTRSKILEFSDNRFGLPDLRETILKSGQADWMSWAAAVGERGLKPAARNHRLTYFSKVSPMNRLVFEIVSQLP
jgi:hypothetical protein